MTKLSVLEEAIQYQAETKQIKNDTIARRDAFVGRYNRIVKPAIDELIMIGIPEPLANSVIQSIIDGRTTALTIRNIEELTI